jgi:hypothetical protein
MGHERGQEQQNKDTTDDSKLTKGAEIICLIVTGDDKKVRNLGTLEVGEQAF